MLLIRKKSTIMQRVRIGLFSITALALAFVGLSALPAAQAASSPVAYTEVPFTAAELTNWSPDRSAPSGGASSVTFDGRSNVLEMGVVGEDRSTISSFYYTEGLQRQLATDPDAVKADLYVDSAWLDTSVRAGLWGVGHDTDSAVSAYPIVEFISSVEYTGWRSWDGVVGGWTNLTAVPYVADEWNTVALVLNDETGEFDVYINEVLAVSSGAGDTVNLGAVILNQYNYGSESTDYTVRWSNFAYGNVVASPVSKDACKGNGWTAFGFRNQGQCIQYVNTGKDSR